jgi:hypothetical protein
MAGSMPFMWGPLGVPLAVVAVGVDTPLSLVGDIVTLPVVYARIRAGHEENSAPQELSVPVQGDKEVVPGSAPQGQ